ncbi:hypothetical protein RchiOBHm_Chr6g0312301 [Rosa chinensis]|uniref:PGG domain-containing protein n=1 Tax=Rosa chinensis TaxID=74649 RepID=A0A2P6Q1M5_ROSCH|nr:uncharacterized protein LOC112168832 [Rosa chinensis]PRQ28093.1 hypothetical protein RchiOBHm_Chr6g0312301 [Rosa chinensis]
MHKRQTGQGQAPPATPPPPPPPPAPESQSEMRWSPKTEEDKIITKLMDEISASPHDPNCSIVLRAALSSLLKTQENRVSPSIQQRPSPFPKRQISVSDSVTILIQVLAIIPLLVGSPTSNWFSPTLQEQKCTCASSGETPDCQCIPVPFIIFQGVMTIMFAIVQVLLHRRMIGVHRLSYIVFSFPIFLCSYLWLVFTITPVHFRLLVFLIDVGVVITVSAIVVCIIYWRARASPTLPVDEIYDI